MGTKTLNAAAFTAKLLAPLPTEEVQSAAFTRDLTQDWNKGMEDVRYAEYGHFYEATGLRLGVVGHCRRVAAQMCKNWYEAQAEQCLIPAPTAKELRWKMRLPSHIRDREDVAAAITRDEARLAPTQEA